ncbi:S-layer homology domain-containing protein [Paenibacillus pasadenensis]|nr:S-layer homology domain-containing protein [Paenibacillus pasadenensis]
MTNGTGYKFRLVVTGGAYAGESNEASATPVAQIADLSAAPGDGEVGLTFTAASGATSVTVEQSSNGGATWTTAATVETLDASSTSATVTGLNNGQTYTFRLKISGGPHAGISNEVASTPASRPVQPQGPIKEYLPIVVDGGNDDNQLANLMVERTVNSDGSKHDTVTFNVDKASATIQKAKESSKSKIRLVVPDIKDEVSQLNVVIPRATVDAIASGKVDFEIYTDNARILVPYSSFIGLEKDIYFRLVPMKKAGDRKIIEERASKEAVVQKEATSGKAKVVARPIIIETNLNSRAVSLVLPLKDVELPSDPDERAALLAQLIVYIEHSDGERAIVKPEPVSYQNGEQGIQFSVLKFSTFTILKINGNQHQSYINGYADRTFRPESSITRAEMAAMMTRLNLGAERRNTAIRYLDVLPGHWAEEAIRHVSLNGLMKGYSVNLFAPGKAITRGELATIITRFQGLTDAGTATAVDINEHWANKSILLVLQAGYMTTDSHGNFRPNDLLTRAEAVTVLNRVLKRGPEKVTTDLSWIDVPASHWANADIAEASQTHFFMTDAEGNEIVLEQK